jgi:hypothetical protein
MLVAGDLRTLTPVHDHDPAPRPAALVYDAAMKLVSSEQDEAAIDGRPEHPTDDRAVPERRTSADPVVIDDHWSLSGN